MPAKPGKIGCRSRDPPRHAASKSSGKCRFPQRRSFASCRHALPGGSSDPEGRAMLTDKIEAIGRAPAAALDALARAVWQDFGTGKLTEAEAATISEAIEARRKALKRPVEAHSPLRVSVVREGAERTPAGNVAGSRAPARAPARGPRQLVLRIPRPARYDRARSRERRRRLAYSGPLPAHLAAAFTPTEVAVLRIVADEHRDRGGCALCVDEIAARAGVCRRTVQNALRHAERLGLVSITERRREGARNLPNIVRVVSREWLAWIKHHSKTGVRHGRASVPAARHGVRDVAHGIGCRTVHPTDKACSFKGIEGRKSE